MKRQLPGRVPVISTAAAGSCLAAAVSAQNLSPTELADIRDPVTFVPWLLVAAVILVILLLSLLFLAFLRIRRRRRSRAATEPSIAPDEWARSELQRLERESGSLDDKAFASGVADVLREYLERAFRLPAPERTTEEFLQLLSADQTFQEKLKEALRAFLLRSDLVKFARQPLGADNRGTMMAEARQVVDQAEAQRRQSAAETALAEQGRNRTA